MLRQAINNNPINSLTSSIKGLFNTNTSNRSSKAKSQMIEEVIGSYFSLLSTAKYKKLTPFYAPNILQAKSTQKTRKAQAPRTLKALYAILKSEQIQGYDILTQYKIPFSKMGVDQYLTYAKLTTNKGFRYMALWIGRNLNSRQSWKIYDLYLHSATATPSIGVESTDVLDQQFTTLCGKVVDDSTLTSFFFTRLFTDRAQVKRVYKLLKNAEGSQAELIGIVKGQSKELLNILNDGLTTHSLNILSSQLREKVRHIQSAVLNSDCDQSNTSLKLLSVLRLPSISSRQTRILAHIYVPSTDRYLSVWFKRTLSGDLSWKIDDFYIHRFTQVDHVAYVNEDFCQQAFQTGKNRAFYAADLMSKYIIGQKAIA